MSPDIPVVLPLQRKKEHIKSFAFYCHPQSPSFPSFMPPHSSPPFSPRSLCLLILLPVSPHSLCHLRSFLLLPLLTPLLLLVHFASTLLSCCFPSFTLPPYSSPAVFPHSFCCFLSFNPHTFPGAFPHSFFSSSLLFYCYPPFTLFF